MARKVIARDFGPHRRATKATSFSVNVEVSAEVHSRKNRYHASACIVKRGQKPTKNRLYGRRCGTGNGSAPRRAVAAAFKDLTKAITHRSSAFHGY